MRFRSTSRVILCCAWATVLLLGVASAKARSQHDKGQPSSGTLTTAEWATDLDQLTTALRETHPAPYHHISEDEFEASVESLRNDLPQLTEHQIVLRLATLVASIGDGHTRLTLPLEQVSSGPSLGHSSDPDPKIALRFKQLPLTLDLFDDGLFVTGATRGQNELIGARVTGIGSRDATEALEAVRPLIYVDNEQTFKLLAPTRLTLPEVVADLGVTPSSIEVPLHIIGPDGAEKTVTVGPMVGDEQEWTSPPRPDAQRPVWLRSTPEMDRWDYSTPYRLEYLEDANSLYVQINEIANDGEQSMAEFMSNAVTEAERRSVDKFVIDLRKNHGGSGSWNRGIILALLSSPRVNQFGRLYVLIGRQTFSAAIMLVGLLEEWTEALFVGEPTGSALNQYGDPNKFQLENSGLTVRVSTIYWHSWLAGDNRPAYPPHILVGYDSVDYFGGVDPVLEAALAHQVPADTSNRFRLLLESDVNQAAIWILKQMSDPAASSVGVETVLEQVGRELVTEGQLETGRYAYLIGINFFPESEKLKAGLESIPQPED